MQQAQKRLLKFLYPVAILLVEQKLTIALKISKRIYVMGHGHIVFESDPAGLAANAAIRKEWLEV